MRRAARALLHVFRKRPADEKKGNDEGVRIGNEAIRTIIDGTANLETYGRLV